MSPLMPVCNLTKSGYDSLSFSLKIGTLFRHSQRELSPSLIQQTLITLTEVVSDSSEPHLKMMVPVILHISLNSSFFFIIIMLLIGQNRL